MAEPKRETHDLYPLKTVSQVTGLSPDIIRAWEKRHCVVAPIRGPRGARLYSKDDIAHLRLLGRVVASGRAIGDVAALERVELEKLATLESSAPGDETRAPSNSGAEAIVERVLEAVRRFDGRGVVEQLADGMATLGAPAFVSRVAAPLLVRVGEGWERGELSIAHEHMVSSAMRSLLNALVRNRGFGDSTEILLATPSDERHEGGLLMVALLLSELGIGCCYLGIDVPSDDIAEAANTIGVSVVAISVVNTANRKNAIAEIKKLDRELAAGIEIWLGGSQARAVQDRIDSTRLRLIDRLDELEAAAMAFSRRA